MVVITIKGIFFVAIGDKIPTLWNQNFIFVFSYNVVNPLRNTTFYGACNFA